MLLGIALAYSLLCMRLGVQMEASWANGQGSASLCVGALGVYLRRDFLLTAHGLSIRARTRYGKEKKKKPPDQGRKVLDWLREAMQSKKVEYISLHLRMGLGDACETAVASGAVQALVRALAAAAGNSGQCELRVTPDFSRTCLIGHLQAFFSWQVGDVLFAALKQVRRKRQSGLKWSSIPLRA